MGGAVVPFMRRGLGYVFKHFKDPGDVQRANEVAIQALKSTVKDPETGKIVRILSPSTEVMQQRMSILLDNVGKKIGNVIDTLKGRTHATTNALQRRTAR